MITKPFIIAIAMLLCCPVTGDEFQVTLKEMNRAGILIWRITIPEDLYENEYLDTEWRIDNEKTKSGLHFKGVPAGQTATVILWTGEYVEYCANGSKGDPPEGMPYHISWPGTGKNTQSRHGRLLIPKGWEQTYGRLASGPHADNGWLMLQSNEKKAKTQCFAMLDYTYTTETEEKTTE